MVEVNPTASTKSNNKKKLIAGAAGFIGSAIVRALLADGEHVKVLVRKTTNMAALEGLITQYPGKLEVCYGDIRDQASVEAALADCDVFYFTAAYFAHWTLNPDEQYDVNIRGTRASMMAAVKMGVERVVYTSTNNAIAASGPTPITEDDPNVTFNYWKAKDNYSMSKYMGENEVWRIIAQYQLPAVIVNPTLVIGPHDYKPTPSNQLVMDVATGNLPAYIDGGLNIVDVDDVARGHILAAQKGRLAQRYLLGHRNVTIGEYISVIRKVAGVNHTSFKIPHWVGMWFAWVLEAWANWVSKKHPMVTQSEICIGKMTEWYDCSKAVKELGLPQSPLEDTIKKTLDFFKEQGTIKK